MRYMLFLSLFLSGCSLWTTDAPTDMEDEHESVVRTLDKSCKKGNGISCENLAFMYEHGQNVSEDEDKAEYLYKKACGLGISSSCGR